ncbi:MAG: protein kinase [Terriglobia bacterium]
MIRQTVAHFRVLQQLGAGGMGVVYLAEDTKLERRVALKFLPKGLFLHPESLDRFKREAQTASALNHPNICTIYEIGEADGQAYITMEYVEGKPLNELSGGEGLPLETATRYAMQVADALDHAHHRGVIHRDLKGSNVVIGADGRAKVLDFGLAKRLRDNEVEEATRSQESLTVAGAVMGTVPYMAPEVLRGKPADARSDIWSFGVMLYEMLTGTRPFKGITGFELSSAILNHPPAPLPPHIPPSLRAILQRCLTKEPEQRYQRASEVRAALEAVQLGSAIPQIAAPARTLRSPRRVLAAAGVLALLVAGALVGLNWSTLRERLGGLGTPQIRSVAVLPLTNLSGDPEQEYFADGMTEALITELGKIRALRIISRTSVMRYKGTRTPLAQIVPELNVDAVVEGSVQRAGAEVGITARLISGRTEAQLWSQSYLRNQSDVMSLQSDVARAIAREIKIAVTPAEDALLAEARPVNPEAHEAYLRGRFYQSKMTPENLMRGHQLLLQAIEKDPEYASAYAALSTSYFSLGNFGVLPPREAYPKAREAADKALRLDAKLAAAHMARAMALLYNDRNWLEAEKEFEAALELNPNDAAAYNYYAVELAMRGRTSDALRRIRQAEELDPLSLRISYVVGALYNVAGRYDEAIAQCRKILDLDPNFAVAYHCLGWAFLLKGSPRESVEAFQKAVALSGESPPMRAALACAYAEAGKRNEALRILDDLQARARQGYVLSFHIALLHARLGHKDAAFEWLERAYQEHSDWMLWLKVARGFENVRDDPRFQDLLRRLNFPA